METIQTQWEVYHRQGAMYEWWRQQDDVRVWYPLVQVDRRLRYLVAQLRQMRQLPHPSWLTELTSQAIDACGLNLRSVQRYVDRRAPVPMHLMAPLVREAYRRETIRRRWGSAWKGLMR
jgi:hypothetical protein